MNIKIGAPLYIVREEAQKDLLGVLEKMSRIGFDGVELLGFCGKTAGEIRSKLDELGIAALGSHVNVNDFAAAPEQTIADHKTLGCEFITIGAYSRDLQLGSAAFDEYAARIGELSRLCRSNGFTPMYHNHDYEFSTKPSIMDVLMDRCGKDGLALEPDLGWMLYMGEDPEEYLSRYKDRCPIIHLKDAYATDFSKTGPGNELGTKKADPEKGCFEFRPTGFGLLNLPKILPLCLECKPKWFVLDHDMAYERDSYADLEMSLWYTRKLMEIAGH